MNQLGAKLRSLRLRKGLTQQQLADLLGVTARTIQNYETDNRTPTLQKTFQLSIILGFKLDELSVRVDCTPNRELA